MINVSSNYLNLLNEKTSIKSRSKIVVDGVEYISEIKSSPKMSHKNKTIIGGFPIKTCSFELLNQAENTDFLNKEVKVYKGIEVDGNFEYVLQGIFIPRNPQIKTNISQKTISFENIQDKGQLFDVPYKSDLKWEIKHTGKEIVQEICNLVNVELAYDTFNWSTYSFNKPNFKEGISCREVISKLAEIGGSIAIINSLGKLEIKSQKVTNHSVTAKRYSKLSKEQKYGEINVIVLGKKDINDDIYYPDTLPINKKEYKILDNPFVDLNRQEMIGEVAKYILGISLIPFEIDSFIDGFCYELNDVISITDKNKNTFDGVILNYETNGRISSKIGADVQDAILTNYNLAGSNKQKMRDVKLDVDHINQKIDALTTDVSDSLEKVSQMQMDVDSIKNTVSNVTTTEELTNIINQTVYETTNLISQTGGSNLLKNTQFYQEADEWTKSESTLFDVITGNIDVEQNTTNKSELRLKNGTLSQEFSMTIGKEYTIAFKYQKEALNNRESRIRIYRSDNTYFDVFNSTENQNNRTEYSYTFTALVNSARIEIYTDNDVFSINDLIIQSGTSTEWSPNAIETRGLGHKLSGNALELYDLGSSGEKATLDYNNLTFEQNNQLKAEYGSNNMQVSNATISKIANICGLTYTKIDDDNVIVN